MSRRKGIMLCYPFEEKRLNKWEPPYLVQPKLDGERARAIKREEGWVLLSSEENEIYSVPHILDFLDNEMKDYPLGFELDGELYKHGWPFESIHSVVGRTVNFHPDFDKIDYHVFDLVLPDEPQWSRLNQLHSVLNSFSNCPLKRVFTTAAHNFDEVYQSYEEICAKGYEGIVVRHMDNAYVRRRSTLLMKFKPKKEDTYLIVGHKQMIDKNGNPKEMLGALICSGGVGDTFSVGSGMTDEFRKAAWKNPEALHGLRLRVQYQHISPKGSPRFPVFKEVIT